VLKNRYPPLFLPSNPPTNADSGYRKVAFVLRFCAFLMDRPITASFPTFSTSTFQSDLSFARGCRVAFRNLIPPPSPTYSLNLRAPASSTWHFSIVPYVGPSFSTIVRGAGQFIGSPPPLMLILSMPLFLLFRWALSSRFSRFSLYITGIVLPAQPGPDC